MCGLEPDLISGFPRNEALCGSGCHEFSGRVVVEFGGGKELYPFGWVVGTEDAEIGFKFLIGLFHLSISLEMIGSGESYIVSEEVC